MNTPRRRIAAPPKPRKARKKVIYKRKLKIREALGLPELKTGSHALRQGRLTYRRKPKRGKTTPTAMTPEHQALLQAGRLAKGAWGGRVKGQVDGTSKAGLDRVIAYAQQCATEAVKLMADKKIWIADNDKAEEAMLAALEILNKPGANRDKLTAAKLVLDFTQRKPVAATDVTMHNAEAFLDALLKEEKSDDEDGTP